ncbi:MAG: hypothetical protein KDI56_10010 [Xanthomonadales bacterium]|nr:hypothetical protein [Xanthomonadales bacterium]MCB1628999.1 hypothetical protein [Xanthomonadales bacterium]
MKRPALVIRASPDHASVSFYPKEDPVEGIDERIAKIEIAKELLIQAVATMDDLRKTAESNKREVRATLAQLQEVGGKREAAKSELMQVRRLASADIEVFRKVAGIPSPAQIRRERLLGFVLGVLASIAATAIWWLASRYFPTLGS